MAASPNSPAFRHPQLTNGLGSSTVLEPSVLFSQIAWPGKLVQPTGGIHMSNVVSYMQIHYGFVGFPTTLSEFDLGAGVSFKHGRFSSQSLGEQIVIGEIKFYPNGILVTAALPTEVVEEFISELFRHAQQELGMQFAPSDEQKKYYTSQVEVVFDQAIPIAAAEATVLNKINELHSAYGHTHTPYEKTGFSMSLDTSAGGTSLHSAFSIARRIGQSFAANTYFSEAPLSTKDHIAVLSEYERILLDSASTE